MCRWNKTILAVLMRWDYGIPPRGLSGEERIFYSNFKKLVSDVEVFWFDEYLSDLSELQMSLIVKADEIKPDLIFFIPYTDQFSFETLDYLKGNYSTLAWFGDDQWRFDYYTFKYAPHFTYVSTTDLWSVSKYKKLGIKPIVTQWAAQSFTEAKNQLPNNQHYKYEVSFIGAYNESRGWFIKQLARLGIKVECFGMGWPNGKISFEDMDKIFRTSKVNLNLSNSVSNDIRFVFGGVLNFGRWLKSKKRAEQIKARNFEIPLAGGFQLSNYVLGLEHYFKIGEEVAVFNNPEECAKQIQFFLENEDLREMIKINGYLRTKSEHTYLHRLEKILEEILS